MGNALEITREIRVNHPSLSLLADALVQCVESVVSRPPGPEPVRARQEICLVDRFQQHHDRPLRHLVLEGRDAEWPHPAVRLRDVVPTDRRRLLAARLDALQQVR